MDRLQLRYTPEQADRAAAAIEAALRAGHDTDRPEELAVQAAQLRSLAARARARAARAAAG